MKTTALSSKHVGKINRAAVIDFIRTHESTTAPKIAESLNLKLPTVLRIVAGLLKEKWITEDEERDQTTKLPQGRPPTRFRFNEDKGAIIGLDLGSVGTTIVLANVGRKILKERKIEHEKLVGERGIRNVIQAIKSLVAETQADNIHLLGIAIGVPGVTDPESGLVKWAPSLNWRNVNLKQGIETELQLGKLKPRPVVTVDNDVNLAALGEQWFGKAKGVNTFVFITFGKGLGAGLVLNGVLFRGSRGAAGEIGYLLQSPNELRRSYPKFGANEMKLQQAQLENPKKFLDLLAATIFNISVMFDLELIILGGSLSKHNNIISELERRLDKCLPKQNLEEWDGLPKQPALALSDLGNQAVVLGGVAQALLSSKEYKDV